MRKTLRTLSVTFAAAAMMLVFGATANAGGAHFSFDMSLPIPPLPPIPVPFGFIDVNGPAHGYAPEVYFPAYDYEPTYYAPAYRHTYTYKRVYRERERAYRGHDRYKKHVKVRRHEHRDGSYDYRYTERERWSRR